MNCTMKSVFAMAAFVIPVAALSEEVVLPAPVQEKPLLRRVVEPNQSASVVAVAPSPESVPAIEMEKEETRENKWQFSIGGEYRPNVKARFSFIPALYNAGRARAASMSHKSQGAASSSAKNGDYEDGYVHADSGTQNDGDTSDWSADSWSQYDGGSETVSFSSTYSVSESNLKSPTAASVEEEEKMRGITFDLSRDLFSNGAFKLGLTLGFSYVMAEDLVDFSHSFSLGSTSSSVRKIVDTYDVSYWAGLTPDELHGGGNHSTGALIPATPINSSDVSIGGGSSIAYDGGCDISADFKMYEFRLSLEPEYELLSWLSIYGEAGVSVGNGIVSWETSSWFRGNGRNTVSSSGEEKDVFIQGFAGLGLRVMPFENVGISLFGDYRFGKGEIDVEATPFVGKIETGELRFGAALTIAF